MKYFLSVILLISSALASDIFTYTDKNGNLVFTNIANENTKKVNLEDINISSKQLTKEDITRKKILMEELEREKSAYADATFMLEQAQTAKLNGKENIRYKEHIKLLQNAVIEHQKNIDTLTGTIN